MLLWLAQWLTQFESAFNVFSYLTLRAILATLTALLIAILIGPKMIRSLQRMQIGQTVRDDGPQSHLSKSGTPTMGGVLILAAILTSCLLWADPVSYTHLTLPTILRVLISCVPAPINEKKINRECTTRGKQTQLQ